MKGRIMKSVLSRLAVASVILCAVTGMLIVAVNAQNQDTPQSAAAPSAASPTKPQSAAAPSAASPSKPQNAATSGAASPQDQMPVMKAVGTKASNVYLQSLDIDVEVTGNIASTRYTMVFKNKTNRVLEGELTFPLADGRSVTHYALDIDGKMREAVPVDKAKAARVFEEIEERQVDPGLLEKVEGNNFRTRIYPIPAGGARTISIGYEEELTLENGQLYYRLPLACPNPLETFALKATVLKSSQKPIVPASKYEMSFDAAGENYAASFTRANYRPAGTLVFALPAPADIPQVVTQSAQGSRYFLASVAPKIEPRKKSWADDLAIVWDVSLSGLQRNLEREMETLDIIFAEKKRVNVHLYFLNNRLVKQGEYNIADADWSALKHTLKTAVFDGGTDFSQIDIDNIAGREMLFFSDGLSTLSGANFLKDAAANRPIHCVVSSAKADYSAMKLIAGKTRGKFVNLNALSPEKLTREMLYEMPLFLGAEHGNNVREIYPGIATAVHGNFSAAGIIEKDNAEVTLLFGFGNTVEKRIKIQVNAKNAAARGNIYKIWAQKKAAELDLEYEKNRAELTTLGQTAGIVTRSTSLIVLETILDYVQYEIEPPASEPELLAEYRREMSRREVRDEWRHNTDSAKLDSALHVAAYLKEWWNIKFYTAPAGNTTLGRIMMFISGMLSITCGGIEDKKHYAYADIFPEERFAKLVKTEEVQATLERKREEEEPPTINIKPIKKDNEYLKQLTGKTADDYQIYLKLRGGYVSSPAYYFDMAEWFYTHGDREAALRALTSIAELELENASLYRLLGYRFKEYGEYALEKFVCKKVIEWRPMEPQSYRDYALALADNGEAQAALDSLYSMLTKTYSGGDFKDLLEVIVTEINHLIAKNPNLNTSKIDKRLIINIPVDIRVVINWNMKNTDIDFHLIDPNDEECYYRNRETRIGGRLSEDIMNSYGPEQFMLKRAVKGKYRIFINYYGDFQFTSAGPTTVMAEIFTKYAGIAEQRKVISLQLSKAKKIDDGADSLSAEEIELFGAKGKVEVAEFEF